MYKKVLAVLLCATFSFNSLAQASYVDKQIKSNKRAQEHSSIKKFSKAYSTNFFTAEIQNDNIKDPGLIKFNIDTHNTPTKEQLRIKNENDLKSYDKTANYIKQAAVKEDKKTKRQKTESLENEIDKYSADLYIRLYTIADRLIRANNLDYVNWKLVIYDNTTDLNAFATQANIIGVHASVFENFSNNPHAIAFILSHEFAHHVLGHTTERLIIGGTKKVRTTATLVTLATFGLAFIPITVAEKHFNWNQEFAADALGAEFLIRANYNYEKGMRAVAFMNALPNAFNSSFTHPKISDREDNLQTAQRYFMNDWKKEGVYNVYESTPLECDISSDMASIVLVSNNTNGSFYELETPEQILKRFAYIDYKRGNMNNAIKYFQQWAKITNDYIPHLYTSYAYEYLYKISGNKSNLKSARKSASIAHSLQPDSKEVFAQLTALNSGL